jgi:hypothetical protein
VRTGSKRRRQAVALVAVTTTLLLGLAVTAHADPPGCADGGACALGDVGPGGGTVFFVKAVGALDETVTFPDPDPYCHDYDECEDRIVHAGLTAEAQAALPFDYLEVAPASAEVNRIWSWGHDDVPGANPEAIGAGATNTAAIVAALPGDGPDNAAAHYADAYVNNGLSDWFLPSQDETSLLLIRKQTYGAAMGTFTGYLWTSTQQGGWAAHARNMTTAHDASATKYAASVGVRPVRAFSATAPTTTTTSSTSTSSTSTSTTSSTTTTSTMAPAVTFTPPPTPAPPVTVPAPPTVLPPTPVLPPTSVRGGSAALIVDGAAVGVPAPPGAPKREFAASAAVDADRSIVVSPAGRVWATDPADRHGQLDRPLRKPIVGIQLQLAPASRGVAPVVTGYWLVGADGGVFAFGSAGFHGSAARRRLNAPVVGMTATPSGDGYWLLAADGGVFAFGDARFHGSLGTRRQTQPAVALAATPSGKGYWLVGASGSVTAFGDAAFHGSGSTRSEVVGAAASPSGEGYWLVAADGTVTGYGDVAG